MYIVGEKSEKNNVYWKENVYTVKVVFPLVFVTEVFFSLHILTT